MFMYLYKYGTTNLDIFYKPYDWEKNGKIFAAKVFCLQLWTYCGIVRERIN